MEAVEEPEPEVVQDDEVEEVGRSILSRILSGLARQNPAFSGYFRSERASNVLRRWPKPDPLRKLLVSLCFGLKSCNRRGGT